MNITNLEMIQASMEVIGALFCLITLFILAVNKMTQKTKYLMVMFGLSMALFLFDACAYIFRGNTDWLSIIMTRVSNNGLFVLNICLTVTFVGYFYNALSLNGINLSGIYSKISIFFFISAGACLIINCFTNWMFYFDDDNYYHRGIGWYIYTVFLTIGILVVVYATILIRKKIARRFFTVLLLYEFAPFIAIIIQIFIYGISIANIGITVCLTILLLFNIRQESEKKKMSGINDTKEKTMYVTIFMLILMVICMSASIISCVANIQKVATENAEKDNRNIAHLVQSDIENTFLPYLTVTQMVASDNNLCEILKNTTRETAKDSEKQISDYLRSVKDEFGYQMVFLASDKSNAYYTYNGILKYLDVEKDSHDIWYKEFKESKRKYAINIDTDEANNGALTIFFNREIVDDDGNFLGVGGVGISVTKLQSLLRHYEKEYNLDINLINYNGLVQINSNRSHIEKEYLDNSYLSSVPEKKFVYKKMDNFYRMTYYMDSLDWYLVIDDYQMDKSSAQRIVLPCLAIFMVGLLVMGVAFTFISKKERISSEKLMERIRISLTDELTGLQNRRAYAECVGKISEKKLHDNTVIIMMDVNGLKTVNDEIGHDAGDELLKGSAECMLSAFGKLGNVFRLGGDEFMAVLECSGKEAREAAAVLDEVTASWEGKEINEISISKGVVVGSEHPDMSLNEIEEFADKLMYEDKDAYYKRTGKKRR